MSTRHKFFCSWSGGKDSCLALYRAISAGHDCVSLFTMIDESNRHSRSHGLLPDALRAQADSMGIPLRTAAATWGLYEKQFREQAVRFAAEGVRHGVFGDIDLEPHREWVTRVCGEAGITAHLPLWKGNRRALVEGFLDAGFKAVIVVVNKSKMPERFLGRMMEKPLIGELEAINVDPCGENGEFHTFVYDGPLFKRQLEVSRGAVIDRGAYALLPLTVSLNSSKTVPAPHAG